MYCACVMNTAIFLNSQHKYVLAKLHNITLVLYFDSNFCNSEAFSLQEKTLVIFFHWGETVSVFVSGEQRVWRVIISLSRL